MELQTITKINFNPAEKEKLKEAAEVLTTIEKFMHRDNHNLLDTSAFDFELSELQECEKFLRFLSDD